MASATQRSAALAERLQRLRAGLDKPKPQSAVPLRLAAEAGSSASRSSKSPSEDFEHLPPPVSSAEASTARGQEDFKDSAASQGEEIHRRDQENDFELVASPKDAVQTPSGGSPSSREREKGSPGDEDQLTAAQRPEEEVVEGVIGSREQDCEELRALLAVEAEQRDDMVAQISALRGAYVEARDGHEAALKDVERLQQECQNLSTQLQESRSQSLKQAREEEATNVSRRLARAESAIEQERARALGLEQQLADAKRQVAAGSKYKLQAETLQTAIAGAQHESAALQADLQQHAATVADRTKRVSELEMELRKSQQHASEERAVLEQRAVAAETEAAASMQRLRALEAQVAQLQERKERSTADVVHAVAPGAPQQPEPSGLEMPSGSTAEAHGALQQAPVEGPPGGEVPVLTHAEEATARPAQDEIYTTGQAAGGELEAVTTEAPMASPIASFEGAQQAPVVRDAVRESQNEPGEGQPRWGGLWAYISGADKASDGHEQPGA